MGAAWSLYFHPDVTPDPEKTSSYDPNFGFPNGRKERVMIATEQEMRAAKLPLEERDYCAHKKIDYLACRADVWPLAYRCAHSKHKLMDCMFDDYVLRMKEYERERRLMLREKRIKEKKAKMEFA